VGIFFFEFFLGDSLFSAKRTPSSVFHRVKILSLSLSRFLEDEDDDDQKMFIHMALYERVPRFEKKSHKTLLAKLLCKKKDQQKKDQKRRRKRG